MPRKNLITKKCLRCGKDFQTRKSKTRFCSLSCGTRGPRKRKPFSPSPNSICKRCHSPFYVPAFRLGIARYCSRACVQGTAEQRFWESIDKGGPSPPHCPWLGPCWIWNGHRNLDGYGQFIVNGRQTMATHFCWNLHFGEIQAGMHVLHHCDTPSCCRPDHLWLGTDMDNHRDMVAKGRAYWQKTSNVKP